MCTISFKERVKNTAIENVKKYKEHLMSFEYLVCSFAFTDRYRIVKADETNYLHLIGVNTVLSPKEFFDKCINKTLLESDFDFCKRNQNEIILNQVYK